MVERGWCLLLRLDAVELLDAAVHAVHHRIGKVLDPRAAQRALVLDDPDLRDVNQLSHTCPTLSSALRDDALEGRVLLGVSASHEHVPGLEQALLRWVEDMALRRPLAQGEHDHAG